MLSERPIHEDVRAILMANEPFKYAHLIKFERPSRPDALSGKVSTSAHRYTYLTDASRNVGFDDGSTDLNGVANGTQTYLANKVLGVSTVTEETEAKASSYTITLDGNGLGAAAAGNITITSVDANHWDLTWPANVDLVAQGFREGDKVTLSGSRTGEFNIHSFRAGNVLRLKKIEDTLTAGASLAVTISLSSEEIKSILLDKNASNYASFINREVFIYRAYFQENGMVGQSPDSNGVRGPILLFKGIISGVSFDDDDNGIKVQWTLTSHWGDFAQVRGRITSDEFHRALNESGIPQPESAIKPIYAYDKGFMHADTSVNILATYSVQVEKQDIKVKKGFLGIGSKVKVKKYYVTEGRNTNLDFQLAAKSIPVLYGVRNLVGIPIFADTLKNDSSTVFVVYALSEGEIGGIYDVYIDGKPLICNDELDAEARSTQNADNTVSVICRGRADRGDVLSGEPATNPLDSPIYYYDPSEERDVVYSRPFNYSFFTTYRPYIEPTVEALAGYTGVKNGETIFISSPIEMNLTFYSGTEGQPADSMLVEAAAANNFKIQSDFWSGNDTAEYWGPNHRLIDTAYIVLKIKIKEGETTIPDLEFIARGRTLNCYNYDYSYAPYTNGVSQAAHTNFELGEIVSLYRADTDALINSNVQIIDKWQFVRADGVIETRFRWSETPNLGYVEGVPNITKFYMQDGASNRWYMTTFNYVEFSGTMEDTLEATVTSTVNNAGSVQFNFTGTLPNVGGVESGPALSFVDNNYQPIAVQTFGGAVIQGTLSGTSILTNYNYQLSGADAADVP